MKKGSLIGVEGRIQTGSYEGQDGKRVYTTDVVADAVQFLEPRGGGNTQQGMPNHAVSVDKTLEAVSLLIITHHSSNLVAHHNRILGYQQPAQPPQNQQNYTRVDEDPFANSKGPIEVSEDDLPF